MDEMGTINKILETLKDLVGSRTIWGGVILLANTFFAGKFDPAALAAMPDAASATIMQLQSALAAIGGFLILIGRVRAKPTALATK